jgi:hypothetical protein
MARRFRNVNERPARLRDVSDAADGNRSGLAVAGMAEDGEAKSHHRPGGEFGRSSADKGEGERRAFIDVLPVC